MPKQKQKFTALKSFTYDTRRLLPGDVFEAVPAHGLALSIVKKAQPVREPGKIAPPPAALKAKATPAVSEPAPAVVEDEMTALRAEYQDKVGKRPFMGWDADTVRAKMAEALAEAAVAPAPTESDTPVSSEPETTSEPVTEDADEDDNAS